MSQNSLTLPTTGTVSGLAMTQNMNNALDTLNTLASGASAPGSPEAGQLWHDTTNNIVKIRSLDNTTWIALFTLNETSYLATPSSVGALGECQFSYTSGTVCSLTPLNGNRLVFPSGAVSVIPAAGISSTITNAYINGTGSQTLSASTLYYAYLANISGSYVIDWSTTAYATDTNSGIVIKSGDNTRVLVGAAVTNATPNFVNADGNRLVISWFNRRRIRSRTGYTTNRTTTSSSFVELNSEIRNNVLVWSGLNVEYSITGSAFNSGAANCSTAIAFNGTTAENETTTFVSPTGSWNYPVALAGAKIGLSEGLSYATVLGCISNNTGTWNSTTAPGTAAIALNLIIQG